MKILCVIAVFAGLLGAGSVGVVEHLHGSGGEAEGSIRSVGGENPWNEGQPPKDWWATIKRTHGHVGPWNVLGWRIGQAAIREFDTGWGRHELDIICYVPMSTPYSCLADGVVIGTGNSLGRLDVRLAEVMSRELIHVAVCRKDGKGDVLIFRPNTAYLKRIEKRRLGELETLSHQCADMEQDDLFRIERIGAS